MRIRHVPPDVHAHCIDTSRIIRSHTTLIASWSPAMMRNSATPISYQAHVRYLRYYSFHLRTSRSDGGGAGGVLQRGAGWRCRCSTPPSAGPWGPPWGCPLPPSPPAAACSQSSVAPDLRFSQTSSTAPAPTRRDVRMLSLVPACVQLPIYGTAESSRGHLCG